MAAYIVAIISPVGVLVEDRVAHNIAVLEENGFTRVEQETMELTPDQAALVADQGAGSLQDFLSGPSVVLLLKSKNPFSSFSAIREEVDFTYASANTWTSVRDRATFFPKQQVLERAFLIIKPEYTQQDYATILEMLDANDFVVVGKIAKILSTENATQIFGTNNKDEIDYLTSDVSVSLVVESLNALSSLQLLAGPADPQLAKQIAPTTIRARLGHDLIRNSIYVSESYEQTRIDIGILFHHTPFPMERTLALIKPDAIMCMESILALIDLHQFTVIASDSITLSTCRCEELLAPQRSSPLFERSVRHLSSGPIRVMVLAKAGAIEAWRKICGPEDPQVARRERPNSLRARLGRDIVMNAVYASPDAATASKEIDEYFPQLPVARIPSLQDIQDILTTKPPPRPYVEARRSLQDVLVEGLTALCKVKPTGNDAILWLADWLDRNNPNKPLVEHVVEPEPEKVRLSVELSQRSHGKPINVIWVVGAPYAGKSTQAQRIAQYYGYEHISLTSILAHAQRSHPQYGDIIHSYTSTARSIPTHIIITLLENAMRNIAGHVSGYVISSFPSCLDQAFAFENTCCKLKTMVSLEINAMEATKRAMASHRGDGAEEHVNKDLIAARFKHYQEEIMPVIEHYQVFGKSVTINAIGTPEQVFNNIVAALPKPTKQK